MHIRDLGVSARYLGTVLRRLLDSHFWVGDAPEEEMTAMITDMKLFYRSQQRLLGRPRFLSRAGDVWKNLLGKKRAPVFKGDCSKPSF
jgi:hypothetical protein